MTTFLSIVVLIASVMIIVSVCMQEPKSQDLGAISGQSSNLFGRSAHKSRDIFLNKFIIIGGILIFVSSLLLTAIN
ncbi:MAG: preprotein translocase subunit SecG [Peptoniphilaceae bacterium]|nr:preprotein translocase subunit SecG [Peptoniphilaceae bacterium]MDD7383131.1 preprotein translocase subunit SecG [Peptoniphilaceae bacterium]MDY3738377.1 preprotein translocase subunit SecG [Peptoniphilaceae bacterium]